MKYAGPFHGKALVFLAMILIATYIALKALAPSPGMEASRSKNHFPRHR